MITDWGDILWGSYDRTTICLFLINRRPMKNRFFCILVLVVLGLGQFLVLPIFSSQSLGSKVALFLFFVVALALCMIWQRKEWILPWPLVPLVGLLLIFLVSLFRSTMPAIGIVELGTFGFGLLFCVLVANLSYENDDFPKWLFKWLRVVGSIVGILGLYQYFYWVLVGPSNQVLIPYLLPPCSGRVNGVFGQANLTALLLVSTIIAYLHSYVSKSGHGHALGGFWRDIGFLFVSTAFFLTGSRAGLVSLFAICAVLLLLISRGKLGFSPICLAKILSILVVGFIFSLLPLSPETVSSQYIRPEVSVEARFLFWTVSFLIFLDSPFLGVGLDHFKLLLPSYARKAHDILGFVKYESMGYADWSHNEYLQVLAESGAIGFLSLSIFCFMIIRIMSKKVFQEDSDAEHLLLLLLLFPFSIQAMFSWPIRYPALLFTFFLILGIILSKESSFRFYLRPMARILTAIFFMAFIPGLGFFSIKEYRFTQIKKEAIEKGCGSDNIINYLDDSYLKFKMLREVLPLCISDENSLEDKSLMEELNPYFVEITNLQGTYSQWYNLGLIYRNLDKYAQAEHAFQKAVERQPEFELGWSALHALHIEEAARQTGRPIQDFLPPDKQHSADYYDSLFKRQ